MNKRGFTLIELLAVIVVLAIILLIAMPIVLSVINDAREGAFNSTGYGLVKAAENEHMRNALDGGVMATQTYTFNEAGDGTGNTLLDFSGEAPTSGSIVVEVDGTTYMAISNGAFCAVKAYNSTEVITYDGDGLNEAFTEATNGIAHCNVATLTSLATP